MAELNLKEALQDELKGLESVITTKTAEIAADYRTLHNGFDGLKASNAETAEKVKALVEKQAADTATLQATEAAVNQIKKDLDSKAFSTAKADQNDVDVKAGIEIQRRQHIHIKGSEEGFKPDMQNLPDMKAYTGALNKLAKLGLKSRSAIVAEFTPDEKKAYDAFSMDSTLFTPQMLSLIQDCDRECAYMVDLYQSATVTKSEYKYLNIQDYGAMMSYACTDTCSATDGPEGNFRVRNGQVYDLRGAICLKQDEVREAEINLLSMIEYAANRSHRINRNRSLISGDGVNQPLGWMNDPSFETRTLAQPNQYVSLRRALSMVSNEYGASQLVMHQNMFGYYASQIDANGRFIFGDGELAFTPDRVSEYVRVSNCLPDATEDNTKGSTADPFASGAFLFAVGAFKEAYLAVTKRPLIMAQNPSATNLWCVQYQMWAQDGGNALCGAALKKFIAA